MLNPRTVRAAVPVASLVAVLVVVLAALAACSGDASSDAGPPATPASTIDDSVASHTPQELRQPCALVPAALASSVLGTPVEARRVKGSSSRTLGCTYLRTPGDDGSALLEIRSGPDPTGLDALVGLYLGVDRLRHHPVEVPGADDAEAIFEPELGRVVLFVKQGFVTHSVAVSVGGPDRAERIAVRLAARVVRGDR